VNRIHEEPNGTLAMINDKLHELSVDISQNQMNDIISEINFNFTDAVIETFGKIGQRGKWKQDVFVMRYHFDFPYCFYH
jgi:hypothetical protein